MKHRLIITLLAAGLLLPLAARAQNASEQEKEVLTKIAQCMFKGLPQDWSRAEMLVELDEKGEEGQGRVAYNMMRNLSGGAYEEFEPCDRNEPAKLMLELKNSQKGDRARWTGARFVLHRDGKFDLTFDYSKQDAARKAPAKK